MRFLDAFFTWFLLLPMRWRLMVRVLALVSLAVGGCCGAAANRCERRGCGAVPFGSAVLLPLLIFWVCLGLSPLGVGSVDVASLTGVLLRVFRWWMRFTFRSVRGHVGLVDVETPPSTLVCPCVATLCGLCVATLDSPFERAACNFLIIFNH